MLAPSRKLPRRSAILGILAGLVLAVVLADTARGAPGDIVTVAGNGTFGFGGDGGPAKLAELAQPDAVAALPGRAFLIADGYNCLIRRVSAAGTITTVAGTAPTGPGGGTQHCGFSGDGDAATVAMISYTWSVAPLPRGGFLIDDLVGDCVVREVSKTGTISTVAGTAPTAGPTLHCGYGGDGAPATNALLGKSSIGGGVAALPGGGFLIADVDNCLVRKVSGGIISTVAGVTTGAGSHSNCSTTGDGGPATAAQIQFPIGVAAFANGGYLVPDSFGGCRIRKVTSGGKIFEGAGTGVCGYSGDGGPATGAQISHDVTSASPTPDGGFLLADRFNCIIRRVSADGRIATVAGTPPANGGATSFCGYTGDGHPATSAMLADPTAVAAQSDGGFLIADGGGNVIRRVIGFPPRITFTRHPKAKIKTKRKKVPVTFGFHANEVRSTFQCKLDGAPYRACGAPDSFKVKPGKHTFSVRATNEFRATGPAVSFAFTVKRKKHS